MIKSMTAFARTQSKQQFGSLTWELRSVNHRYLDFHVRLPDDLRVMEGRYREIVNAKLSRGKVECSLRYKAENVIASSVEINPELTKALIHTCEQVHTMLHQSSDINVLDVLKWPGVVKESELDMKPVLEASEQLLQQALEELVQNREREGERLKDLIVQRCDAVDQIVVQVREQMPEIRKKHRQKILERFEELNAEPDQDRLEQELVYLVQKMDVDEELDRLDAHL
jgi:uncharacterized protein (TIGR00255 family)